MKMDVRAMRLEFEAYKKLPKLRNNAALNRCIELTKEVEGKDRQIIDLKHKLGMAEMDGYCIMECRQIIERELGANAVNIGPPGKQILSPFFDDLVAALVQRVKNMKALSVQNLYLVTNGTAANTYISSLTSSPWLNQSTCATDYYPASIMIGGTAVTAYVQTSDDLPQILGGDRLKLSDGRECEITMPDGTLIKLQKNGSYEIIDKDAKVVYRACRIREFNKFLNASDMIEEFIRFCGEHGARQGDVLSIPIKLFVGWLIIKAAEQDGEDIREPIPLKVADLRYPRCKSCGHFLPRKRVALRLEFCAEACIDRALAKVDTEPCRSGAAA